LQTGQANLGNGLVVQTTMAPGTFFGVLLVNGVFSSFQFSIAASLLVLSRRRIRARKRVEADQLASICSS
jgi:hypothetical protein